MEEAMSQKVSSSSEVCAVGGEQEVGKVAVGVGWTTQFKAAVEAGAGACQRGDYAAALSQYDRAVRLDPTSHVLYSNRSAILSKVGRYAEAVDDAERAYRIKPTWIKAFQRKGHALKCMGDHFGSAAAYADGLERDPTNAALLDSLIETIKSSDIADVFVPALAELEALDLDTSLWAYTMLSVIGQLLLTSVEEDRFAIGLEKRLSSAVRLMETALNIGTKSACLTQSLLSSLSTACWKLGRLEDAVGYMNRDLSCSQGQQDVHGQIRAHTNLAMVYLSLDKESDALRHYEEQFALLLRIGGNESSIVPVLSILGRLYEKLHLPQRSVAAHEQCVEILACLMEKSDGGERLFWTREEGGVGPLLLDSLLALSRLHRGSGSFELAEEFANRALSLAKRSQNPLEQAQVLLALGALKLKETDTESNSLTEDKARQVVAVNCLLEAFRLSTAARNQELRCQILSLLTAVYQRRKDGKSWKIAKRFAAKQLQIALDISSIPLEAAACGSLASLYVAAGQYANADRLYRHQLHLARSVDSSRLAYSALKNLAKISKRTNLHGEQLILLNRELLALAIQLDDFALHCEALSSLVGGLVDRFSAENRGSNVRPTAMEEVEETYSLLTQLLEMGDEEEEEEGGGAVQLDSLFHLTRFYSTMGAECYREAIESGERCLMLAQERNDVVKERLTCRCLADTHRAVGATRTALRYYEQELAIAKQCRDADVMMRVYGSLGECYAEAEVDLVQSLDCFKYALALAHISGDLNKKIDAAVAVGAAMARRGDAASAATLFANCKTLAAGRPNSCVTAAAFYSKIAKAYELVGKAEKSRVYLERQVVVLSSASSEEKKRRFEAMTELIGHLRRRGRQAEALKVLEEQAKLAKEAADSLLEAKALYGVSLVSADCQLHHQVVRSLSSGIGVLSALTNSSVESVESRRLLREMYHDLAKCLGSLGHFAEASHCLDQFLRLAPSFVNQSDENAFQMAELLVLSGQNEKALAYLEAVVRGLVAKRNVVAWRRFYRLLLLASSSACGKEDRQGIFADEVLDWARRTDLEILGDSTSSVYGEANPVSFDAAVDIACHFLFLKDVRSAEQFIAAARQCKCTNIGSRAAVLVCMLLGRCSLLQERYEDAKAEFQHAVETARSCEERDLEKDVRLGLAVSMVGLHKYGSVLKDQVLKRQSVEDEQVRPAATKTELAAELLLLLLEWKLENISDEVLNV